MTLRSPLVPIIVVKNKNIKHVFIFLIKNIKNRKKTRPTLAVLLAD